MNDTTPKHGDFDPQRGWYSEVFKGWMRDPAKIGRLAAPVTVNDTHRGEWAQMQAQRSGSTFRPNPQLEQLIKLRESDKPELRQRFDQLATGARRMELHDYEARRRAHTEAGGEV